MAAKRRRPFKNPDWDIHVKKPDKSKKENFRPEFRIFNHRTGLYETQELSERSVRQLLKAEALNRVEETVRKLGRVPTLEQLKGIMSLVMEEISEMEVDLRRAGEMGTSGIIARRKITAPWLPPPAE